jgi:hypothetical protein
VSTELAYTYSSAMSPQVRTTTVTILDGKALLKAGYGGWDQHAFANRFRPRKEFPAVTRVLTPDELRRIQEALARLSLTVDGSDHAFEYCDGWTHTLSLSTRGISWQVHWPLDAPDRWTGVVELLTLLARLTRDLWPQAESRASNLDEREAGES